MGETCKGGCAEDQGQRGAGQAHAGSNVMIQGLLAGGPGRVIQRLDRKVDVKGQRQRASDQTRRTR
ncbi:hypothetical protein D3C73_1426350 [compost metagenome]